METQVALLTEPKVVERHKDELKELRDLLPQKAFYKIIKKDRIQVIDDYQDKWPLLGLRKTMMRWIVYINRGA